ncbi:MAG: hypothetical protein MZV63_01645 [Marinilabiliales bacterium]|nr:hypothetical protein [Marinilabiliales bacterium]
MKMLPDLARQETALVDLPSSSVMAGGSSGKPKTLIFMIIMHHGQMADT